MPNLHMFFKLHTAGIKHYIEPASPKESEVGVYVHKKFVSILIGHRAHGESLDCDVILQYCTFIRFCRRLKYIIYTSIFCRIIYYRLQ